MYFIRAGFILFFCLITYALSAQNKPSIRWEPGLSFTKKINNKWAYNFSIQGRQRFTDFGSGEENFKTDRWELENYGTYTLFGSRKLTAGYMYRTIDPFEAEKGYEHRLSQQFAFLTKYGGYRLSHLFLIAERIRSKDYLTRLSYRLKSDFPLNGENIDEGEFYVIAGNELVYEFNSVGDILENRFSLGIGKQLKKGQKFQFQVVSRYSDLISESRDHILQFESVYYFNW